MNMINFTTPGTQYRTFVEWLSNDKVVRVDLVSLGLTMLSLSPPPGCNGCRWYHVDTFDVAARQAAAELLR